MVILEEPYASNRLLEYLSENKIPVLRNEFSKRADSKENPLKLTEEIDFIEQYHRSGKLYTTSEYALDWVVGSALNDPGLNRQISLMKDKAAFREACLPLYPEFLFYKLPYPELFEFNFSSLKFPCVLKPYIGFLSAGVYTIFDEEDWEKALIDIRDNFAGQAENFPDTVVGKDAFIIESYIEGDEFAIDIYFRGKEPVIVNIFKHPFSSSKDVSDRLYITSKAIFDNYLAVFTEYMNRLNSVLGLENIPIHIELRVDEKGNILPIEINPLRFTGLCLNEINYHITGHHPLHYFFSNTSPDYRNMWKGKENDTYCFSILEKSGNAFDMDAAKQIYSDILEWRAMDNPKLDINAFVFSKTSEEKELKRILELEV